MKINSDNPESTRFLATGYVREPGKGPLSITEVDDTSVTIVSVLFGGEAIRSKLSAGTPLQIIIDETKAIQRCVVRFPVSALRELSWFQARSDIVLSYEHEGKKRKATTLLNRSEDKSGLLESLQSKFPQPFRVEKARAGVFQVAWANVLGAVVSLAGTLWLYTTWDPVQLVRIRHGRLALALGREGCAIIGAGMFLACCIYGWIAVRKHSRRYRCFVE